MRVVVYSAFFPPSFLGGGALKSVSAIVSQAPERFDTTVICSDTDLGQTTPLDVVRNAPTRWESASVLYTTVGSAVDLVRSLLYARNLRPEIVYVNSFFDPLFSILPFIIWRLNPLSRTRFVIAPRGEFGPAALLLGKEKKSAFLFLFRRMYSSKRITWHASSPIESEDIHKTIGQQVVVIVQEDNTVLPEEPLSPARGGITLRAAVLGRLVPVKGIEELLISLRNARAQIVLDIFGPEEDAEYSKRCYEVAESLPPNITVTFKGSLDSSVVVQTLNGYDVLLHPTRGENFSHVIAEALSASLPVMCADVTPWTPRLKAGGGVVLPECSVESWTSAVSAYAGLHPDERLRRRLEAGRAYRLWRRSSAQRHHIFELVEERHL